MPVNAIAPSLLIDMSTKNEEFGLTPCVSSFVGSPPASGACQSDTRSLSLAPTMIDLPSGIQSARAMLRSRLLAGPCRRRVRRLATAPPAALPRRRGYRPEAPPAREARRS